MEIVDYLKRPEHYKELGAKVSNKLRCNLIVMEWLLIYTELKVCFYVCKNITKLLMNLI